MIGRLIFLAALGLIQGRLNELLEHKVTADDRCPTDKSHFLIPHEYDCAKFYYCEFGKKWNTPKDCAPGKEFSYKLQDCIDPTLANCTIPGTPATLDPTQVLMDTPTQAPSELSTESPIEITTFTRPSISDLPNGCPADFEEFRLLPHQMFCNKFYFCSSGEMVLSVCPQGTVFNPKIPVCDWPWNVDCDGKIDERIDDGNVVDGDRSDIKDFLPNGCPSNFEENPLLPNPSDCGSYEQCVRGERVKHNCPPGLHFNSKKQYCDWPENVGCASAGDGDKIKNSGVGGGEGGGGRGGGGGDIEDVGGASESDGENGISGDVGVDGGGDIGELLANGCPTDFEIDLRSPDPSTCEHYYQCIHGAKIQQTCTPGLHFNPIVQECDWPEKAGCKSGDNDLSGVNVDSGGRGNGDQENKCANNCNILPWAHKTDCDKFWICNGEKQSLVVCSEGLHFNKNTFTCDFISNVNCVRETAKATTSLPKLRVFMPWNKLGGSLNHLLEINNVQ